MTAPTKNAAFGFLRGRLNEGSIEMHPHPDLLRELRSVRTRYSAGRASVVLPRVGASHGDLAQALALSVYEHDRLGLRRQPARLSQGWKRRIGERQGRDITSFDHLVREDPESRRYGGAPTFTQAEFQARRPPGGR
jgi:hypothetical protein